MAKTLSHELNSEVRIAEYKKRQIFDDIYILLECNGLDSQAIIHTLMVQHTLTEIEAWQWLRRYKEHKMAEAEKAFHTEMDKLAGEIEQIKMRENGNA